MMSDPKTVRFWTYGGKGLVRLRMEDGDTLRWRQGWPTDEGWSAKEVTWIYKDGIIERYWLSEGRDCDGYLSHTGEDWSERLNAEGFPVWEPGSVQVYDQNAVRAGY